MKKDERSQIKLEKKIRLKKKRYEKISKSFQSNNMKDVWDKMKTFGCFNKTRPQVTVDDGLTYADELNGFYSRLTKIAHQTKRNISILIMLYLLMTTCLFLDRKTRVAYFGHLRLTNHKARIRSRQNSWKLVPIGSTFNQCFNLDLENHQPPPLSFGAFLKFSQFQIRPKFNLKWPETCSFSHISC